jgi:serine/threonine-protein kinase
MMTHANICQVYELGETDGQLYIAMEYLEGVTLLPLLRKLSKEAGALDFGFVAGVIQQATDALHYAHELRERGGDTLGIVHRDVTPTNVFLTDTGVVKVLDFGIAKVKDISANTQAGMVKGKYAYMAPEQLRGAAVDRRADVFALGVLLFELTTRTRLYSAHANSVAMKHILDGHLPDPAERRPDFPRALTAIVQRALARHPADRYPTARALADDLDRVARQQRWSLSRAGVADLVKLVQQRAQLATSTPAWPPLRMSREAGA